MRKPKKNDDHKLLTVLGQIDVIVGALSDKTQATKTKIELLRSIKKDQDLISIEEQEQRKEKYKKIEERFKIASSKK